MRGFAVTHDHGTLTTRSRLDAHEMAEALVKVDLSKVQSVDQRMRLECGSAFANCGRAVAQVRSSYGPVTNRRRAASA